MQRHSADAPVRVPCFAAVRALHVSAPTPCSFFDAVARVFACDRATGEAAVGTVLSPEDVLSGRAQVSAARALMRRSQMRSASVCQLMEPEQRACVLAFEMDNATERPVLQANATVVLSACLQATHRP